MANKKQFIYIVDDEPLQLELLKDHLSSKMAGYEILTFDTGEACLAVFNNHKPSIVFLDYNLDSKVKGAMDGLLVLEKIKKLSPKTEVIMIIKEKWKMENKTDKKGKGGKADNNIHRDNKLYELMKNRDNIHYYEPLIIKTVSLEKKHMMLSEYPNIMRIIHYQPNYTIFNNLKYINNLIKDESLKYGIDTIIINDNYTIDKILLKNRILIRFNPQGTILLPFLMKELRIKNVVFLEDIIDTVFDITIVNHIHDKFINKINKLEDFKYPGSFVA
jgi:CheY-like chemotaxis protein